MKTLNRPLIRLFSIVAAAALLGPSVEVQAGLIINATFAGGDAPSDMAGGGDLTHIFDTAASFWEAAFTDSKNHWVVNIQYQWGALSGVNGQFQTTAQGGDPHRIESGTITFDNSGRTPFFADPTPRDNSEYTQYTQGHFDTPDGPLIISRVYSGATGDAAGRVDLLSIAEHELGHALGLSFDNTGASSPIIVTAPLPFAGVVIPSVGTDHLDIAGALMGTYQLPGQRYLISPVDVLAEAQISRFGDPNLDPYAVPEPDSLALLAIGLVALAAWRVFRYGRPRPVARVSSMFNARGFRRESVWCLRVGGGNGQSS
jgi:hypothetical protein